jgi:hypothetical protein
MRSDELIRVRAGRRGQQVPQAGDIPGWPLKCLVEHPATRAPAATPEGADAELVGWLVEQARAAGLQLRQRS